MNEPSASSMRPNAHTQPAWIGLALSGGGFRATLFHLGVIRLLRDCDLLNKVTVISSVSGGSILAGHLALNWKEYNGEKNVFESAEGKVIAFTKRDLRNSALRRWFCGIIIPVRLVTYLFHRISMRKLRDRCSFTAIFQEHLEELYGGATFQHLAAVRDLEIHMLTTSLTTGELCKFTNTTFEVVGDKAEQVPISFPKLSLATAASSAFPPLCPAVLITPRILNCNEKDLTQNHALSDGGLLDNLGIQELARIANRRGMANGLLIVSDAGANFDWKPKKRYSFVLSLFRNIRANDIIMRQAGKLLLRSTDFDDIGLCTIDIHRHLNDNELYALRPEHQTVARNIRTDFNSFSDAEIGVLIHHGYAVAHAALREHGIVPETFQNSLGGLPADLSEKQMEIQDAKSRKWRRLFAPCDYMTWVIVIAACGWVALIAWGVYWHPLHRQMEASSRTLLEEQRQSRAREDELLFGLPDRTDDKAESHIFTVRVVEATTGQPIAGAAVKVRVGDDDQIKYEGRTGENGLYVFTWDVNDKFTRIHMTVTKEQFFGEDGYVVLGERSGHLALLNREN